MFFIKEGPVMCPDEVMEKLKMGHSSIPPLSPLEPLHFQGLTSNLYPEPNQFNSTYYFKFDSNIVLPSTLRPSKRSFLL